MTRALVLSGGGPVGIAWEAGLLAGLAEGGVDLATADYILGTSAGSFVGSQLAMGRKAGDMAGAILKEADRVSPAVAAGSRPSGGGGAPNLGVLFQKMAWGGFFSMLGFLGILAFGWFYLLKRGALEWE